MLNDHPELQRRLAAAIQVATPRFIKNRRALRELFAIGLAASATARRRVAYAARRGITADLRDVREGNAEWLKANPWAYQYLKMGALNWGDLRKGLLGL